MLRIVGVIAAAIALVAGYSSGPPPGACSTRIPGHGVPPQTTDCPYVFVALGWKPGEFVKAGIFAEDEQSKIKFKGFLASVYYKGKAIGTIKRTDSLNVPANTVTQLPCGDESSISHADADGKSEVYFEWKAPADLDPNAELETRLTIVQEKEVFWVDCQRAPYYSEQKEQELDAAGAASSTSTAAPNPTTRRSTTPRRPATAKPTARRPPPPPPARKSKRPPTRSRPTHKTKHEMMSATECKQNGIMYSVVPNTDCKDFKMHWGEQTAQMKCPGTLKFSSKNCVCSARASCAV